MSASGYEDMLKGQFNPATGLPEVPPKIIRVFLSSTHADTLVERHMLMQNVYPSLREYCKQSYGLEFHLFDPRWAEEEEWDEWNSDRQLCLQQVIQCKQDSAGPTFVTLVGQHCGSEPVPFTISVPDFEVILESLSQHRNRDTRDAELLHFWYLKDTNVMPAVYRLVDKETGLRGQVQYYEKNSLIMGYKDTNVSWEVTRANLKRLISKGVEYAVADKTMTQDVATWYTSSDLEKEIDLGILRSWEAERYCMAMLRNIVDLKNYLSHKSASKFVKVTAADLEENGKDVEKYLGTMNTLKCDKIPSSIGKKNCHYFDILWRYEGGVDPTFHAKYLNDMCEAFRINMIRLIDDCANSIKPPQEVSPLVDEVIQHWTIARDRAVDFVGRADALEVINSYILSNDDKPLVLHGESGSGKTTLMAKTALGVCTDSDPDEDTLTIVRFIGSTTTSCDTRQLLFSICTQVAACLGRPSDIVPNEYKELQGYFFDMLATFPEDKNLVILLDGLDLLAPQYNAHYLYWVPKKLNENVKVVMSTLPDAHEILRRLQTEVIQNDNNFFEVPPMPLNECLEMLETRLGQHSRRIHPDQQTVVMEGFRNCSYPLYVLLAVAEVRSWTSSADPIEFPLTSKDLFNNILERLEEENGPYLTSRSLGYLTASTTGLSDCEMEDLLSLDDEVVFETFKSQRDYVHQQFHRVPAIAWLRLKEGLSDFLTERENEGIIVSFWFHRMFAEVVKSRYLGIEETRREIHSTLADYYLGIWHGRRKHFKYVSWKSRDGTDYMQGSYRLAPSQPLTFEWEGGVTRYNKRKYEQVPRHLYLSGRFDELNSFVLFSYEFLYNKTKALSLEHVLADFVLNPGVEATLVERAMRDSQPFIESNIDNMAAEITGRLLAYHNTHPNIRKLISECDTHGLKHCAFIPNFPYHQVPGSPLRYTVRCRRRPSHLILTGENSRYLVVKEASDPLVEVIDLVTGESSGEVSTSVGDMYLTPNGHYLVIADHINEKAIKVHSVDKGRFIGQLIPMNSIKSEPKQKYKLSKLSVTDMFICFTVTTGRSHLCIADVEFSKFTEIKELQGRSTVCEITPDSRYVFCNSNETLLAYDLCTLEQTTDTELEHRPTRLVFTADATKGFHINGHENKVHVILLREGKVDFAYKIPVEDHFCDDHLEELKVSTNQEMVLVVGRRTLLVYHVVAEKAIAHFRRPAEIPAEFKLPRSHYQEITFTNADFSPDNKFVMATIFRNVYVWNVGNGRLLTTLQAPVGIIREMRVPSDRGQIVTHLDGTDLLHVWSLGDAIGHVGMLDRLTAPVQDVITTADDTVAFVRCHDSDEVGVLDMKNGQLVDLLTHESKVKDYNITADGQYAIVALEDAKPGAFNKIWHIPGRRVIYEYGNVAASVVPLTTECTMISIMQGEMRFNEPYHISQFKFRDGTFEEYQFDQTLPFMLRPPFITPSDKYLVVLSADSYDDANAYYENPTICAVSLKANVDISTYSARELREVVQIRRILHIRPYADNSYTVIVLFTNEPDIKKTEDRRKAKGYYDYTFSFMIFDVAAGVVCQVLEDFLSPRTPVDQILFTEDVSVCIDHQSNLFDMATGYYMKCISDKEYRPRALALSGTAALYYDSNHLYALRLSDGKMIGNANTHNEISCLMLCHDDRTVVLGCKDGSLMSYVLIDENLEQPKKVLPKLLSRMSPLKAASSLVRSWDRVDFENAANGPPYSRPPSAVVFGPTDRDVLKKVKPISRPISRERPVSDTVVASCVSPTSRACIVM